MKQVWMTDDGKCFETELEAKRHEDKIDLDIVEFQIIACTLKEEWINYGPYMMQEDNGRLYSINSESALTMKVELVLAKKDNFGKYIIAKGINTDLIMSDIMMGQLKMIGTNS